ncbi:MAG: diaminopimelate dehydrogenase [Clostridiales bacterium]|nr:diaminopimelate dehydrogenase [Clostridiales bacterium]
MKIRMGIVGYGNLGRGMEYAIMQNEDMELRYIFTRRAPAAIEPVTGGVKVLGVEAAYALAAEIDVMMLCGGSAYDLPLQTPAFAKYFNVVDSFDTHAKIPEHFHKVDEAAKSGGKTAIISSGWDPGVFSLNRLIAEAMLPQGNSYTFWGNGVSQGHSDAIRRIKGVQDARQYTVPLQSALDAVRSGQNPVLTTRQKHKRVCYVVAQAGADPASIEQEIVSMPHYFADYDTSVHFISAQELAANHAGMPHGGFVIRGGKTGPNGENTQIVEYALKLESNPEFTASAMAICARAAYRLNAEGRNGCKTIFDIPPAYFSTESAEELRKKFL